MLTAIRDLPGDSLTASSGPCSENPGLRRRSGTRIAEYSHPPAKNQVCTAALCCLVHVPGRGLDVCAERSSADGVRNVGTRGDRPWKDRTGQRARGDRGGGGTRPVSKGRRDRPSLRIPHHEFDGRQLDCGGGVDRLCPGRNTGHETGARRSAESLGMARRRSVRFSGKHHRPASGQADLLVLCHRVHFHSVRELGWPHPRGRHDRVGTSDPRGFRDRSTASSAGRMPTST